MSKGSTRDGIDPRTLGLRIQEARKERGITQQDAAAAIGVSRPTYIALEKGERPAQPRELVHLADLLGRSMHDLLRQRPPVRGFVAHFRSSPAHAGDGELDEAVRDLQRRCEDYLELERLCEAPMARQYPTPYLLVHRDVRDAAEEIAAAERSRLGLGDGPAPDLRKRLEGDVGLRIFYLQLPSRTSGLFIYTEELGGCIAIHGQHRPGRQVWSLAHEYAHFLVHRYEAEATVFSDGPPRSARERFADAFAGAFLMPTLGLRRRFHQERTTAGAVTPATLVTLADAYAVSVEAMARRLEDLRMIGAGTWDDLKDSGFRVQEARALLGLGEERREPEMPLRYTNLAVEAFDQGKLSEGELMEILRTDRQRVREIVQALRGDIVVPVELAAVSGR